MKISSSARCTIAAIIFVKAAFGEQASPCTCYWLHDEAGVKLHISFDTICLGLWVNLRGKPER
jgi:hypothetical protein